MVHVILFVSYVLQNNYINSCPSKKNVDAVLVLCWFTVYDAVTTLIQCLQLFLIQLKVELLTQFTTSTDENYIPLISDFFLFDLFD